MDTQTTILVGLAALFLAGIAVSVGGWVLFARERRAGRRVEPATTPAPPPDAE